MKLSSILMILNRYLLPVFAIVLTSYSQAATERLEIGKFRSRALWTKAESADANQKLPAILMIPGSGANGPEEMSPATHTADGRDHALFSEMSEALRRGGSHTLALGKPGVEYFTSWLQPTWFYDLDLYKKLKWKDLIDNIADGVQFLKQQPSVDSTHIYVLGHSEGTQVSVDYAHSHTDIAGVILLGYAGEDMGTTADWQLFKREIEYFVITDVDKNNDGFVTRLEAMIWPEMAWDWQLGQDKISISEIETKMRQDPMRIAWMDHIKSSELYSDGILNRGSIYELTASLKQAIYVYTGNLDLQTRASESIRLANACIAAQKQDCYINIVPELGHGFSPPKGPRAHPLLDMTLGPIDNGFKELLVRLGKKL